MLGPIPADYMEGGVDLGKKPCFSAQSNSVVSDTHRQLTDMQIERRAWTELGKPKRPLAQIHISPISHFNRKTTKTGYYQAMLPLVLKCEMHKHEP